MSHLNINGVDKPLDHIRLNNVRSENLWDYTIEQGGWYAAAGTIPSKLNPWDTNYPIRCRVGYMVPIPSNTMSLTCPSSIKINYVWIDANGVSMGGSGWQTNGSTATAPEDATVMTFILAKVDDSYCFPNDFQNIMIVSGSTALPYQPYLITKEAWEAKSRVTLHGITNPLCGIGTYKDTLDLSTGGLTRYVKKLVLTGQEDWGISGGEISDNAFFQMTLTANEMQPVSAISSHFTFTIISASTTTVGFYITTRNHFLRIRPSNVTTLTLETFKQWLSDQYTAGTPVTVWYVLATPETEQITVPSNLTGIVEGYLTQTGTPTPSNPIYPTANGTLEQGGTYSLDTGAYAIAWGRADTFTGTGSISARCYGLPVKSWEIDGNTQQSGTPDPDNPIMPTFVGERTENLFSGYDIPNQIPDPTGALIPAPGGGTTSLIPITNGDIFMSGITTSTEINFWLYLYAADKTYVGRAKSIGNGETTGVAGNTIEGYANAKYARVRLDILTSAAAPTNVMLNTGSTAKSYEPYGYKLNITSAGQTVPVYLGQVQTLRKIQKLVLDGTEDWGTSGSGDTLVYYTSLNTSGVPDPTAGSICTHLEYGDRYTQGQFDIGESGAMRISAKGFASLSAFKQFLVDEYAAGTPVTVWYVLATPVTGIVNEPLAKIGTYVDTLTSAQAGITIPTTDGSTTISVDTTLAPSRFELKVHAKPIHFGFKIDKSVSDPSNAVIYTHDAVTMTPAGMDFTNGVFDYGSWENVWFIKNARPVMLNFDGTEAYDLDPNDYSKKLDGTPSDIADSTKNMNAMIAFPTVWIKRTDDASYNYIEISDRQIDSDFHAYAHEDANGVVKPYIYLPIYKGSMVDGKLRSISGVKPQSSTTAQQEVDAASALGTGWQIWDYSSKEMLCDLLTLIGKTLDTQGKFGQGHSTGGSSESDFLDCGTLNDKGKFFGYSTTTSQVKCFGMEALWGERWDRELGLILDAGIYKIKEHPAYNLTGDGYTAISTSVAKSPTSNNYIKTEVSTRFGSLPTVVGGTSSTYYCDYFHQSQTNIRVARRGGHCDDGAGAGLRSVNVNSTASNSYWTLGASPVYK